MRVRATVTLFGYCVRNVNKVKMKVMMRMRMQGRMWVLNNYEFDADADVVRVLAWDHSPLPSYELCVVERNVLLLVLQLLLLLLLLLQRPVNRR